MQVTTKNIRAGMKVKHSRRGTEGIVVTLEESNNADIEDLKDKNLYINNVVYGSITDIYAYVQITNRGHDNCAIGEILSYDLAYLTTKPTLSTEQKQSIQEALDKLNQITS